MCSFSQMLNLWTEMWRVTATCKGGKLCDVLAGGRCETRKPCGVLLLSVVCINASQQEIACHPLVCNLQTCSPKVPPGILTLLDTVEGKEEVTQHLGSSNVLDTFLVDSHAVQHLRRQWTHPSFCMYLSSLLNLKGNRTRDASGLTMQKTCSLICTLHLVVPFKFMQMTCFSPSDVSSTGCSHAGLLFTHDKQKRVGLWSTWHFATRSGSVYGVTDTNCQPQYGSTSWLCFGNFQTQIF